MIEIICRLIGHKEGNKVVMAIGRKRHFFRCKRCGTVYHNPPEDK